MTAPEQPYPTRADTFAAFSAHVSRGKAAMFQKYGVDVVMGERQGTSFHDAFDGRRLFNCHCNGGVYNLGHRHPAVLAALRGALDTLDVGNHHLVSGLRARLAERLAATTEGRLPGVVFGVAGGEAIDLAIKVARAATRRRGVVSASGGYHGQMGAVRRPCGASGATIERFHDVLDRPLERAGERGVVANLSGQRR